MEPVIQYVQTSWTKASRGAPDAARRNSTPHAFRLPSGEAPLVHQVLMREENGFSPEESVGGDRPSRRTVDVRQQPDGLLVRLVAEGSGMPVRRRRTPQTRLVEGEWLQWLVNYRFVGCCTGEWFYRQDVVNVAAGPVDRDLFLGTPDHRIDEREHLY